MGCACACSSPDAQAAPQIERTINAELAWVRLGGGDLEEPLHEGWVKLVRADWLVKLSESGGILRRRQDLPAEAFVSLDELKEAGPAVLSGGWRADGEWLRVIVLSYPWLRPGHPDPFGESLCLIAKALKHYVQDSDGYSNGGKPHGVLIDFTALPQAPRTEDENRIFKLALPALNLFYSHPQTIVLKVTTFPEGYPDHPGRKYKLPEGANTVAYPERGWCFAESAMSGLVKDSNKILDLGRLSGNELCEVIRDSRAGRAAPLHPEDFKLELDEKTFTSKKADFDKVAKLYSGAFERHLACAVELDYSGLGWDAVEVRKLVRALQGNHVLRVLNLCHNHIGSEGAAALGEAFKDSLSLHMLDLAENSIGEEGAVALGEALKDNGGLQALTLRTNGIRTQGAIALGEVLRSNVALQSLDLGDNRFCHEGTAALGEGLKHDSVLQALDLRTNGIGVKGARALGEALKHNQSLRSLDLCSNHIGDKGAAALGEALKYNGALQSLDLFGNGISDEGVFELGEALLYNTALTMLYLEKNSIGDLGAIALGQALKQNVVLQCVSLERNRIDDEGKAALTEAAEARKRGNALLSIDLCAAAEEED